VVADILDDATPLHDYKPGTWGPEQAAMLLDEDEYWHDPKGQTR
jgi:glucose-6-phosphate 1-dehydrogenase